MTRGPCSTPCGLVWTSLVDLAKNHSPVTHLTKKKATR